MNFGLFEERRLLGCGSLSEIQRQHWGPIDFGHWRLKMLFNRRLSRWHQADGLKRNRWCARICRASIFHILHLLGVHPDHKHRGLGHVLMGAIDSVMLEDPKGEGGGHRFTLPK